MTNVLLLIAIVLLVILVIKSFWENIQNAKDRFNDWKNNRAQAAEDDDAKKGTPLPVKIILWALVPFGLYVLFLVAKALTTWLA